MKIMKHFSTSIYILLLFSFSKIGHSQNWVYVGTISNPGNQPNISVVNSKDVWVADGEPNIPKIFRSSNGGVNWSIIPAPQGANEIYSLWAISPDGAFVGEGIVNGNARLFYTPDAGATWQVVAQSNPNQGFFNGIVFSRKDTTFGFALAERIFKTTNGGQNWTMIQSGLNGVSNAHNSLFMIDNNFYGFGMNQGAARIRVTTDGGASFFNQTLNITGNYTSAVAFHSNKIYGVAATSTSMPFIARTVDGGATWLALSIDTGLTGTTKIKWVNFSSVVYIMAENGRIKRSLDNGLTWSSMATANVTDLYHFDFHRIDNIIYGYAVSRNGAVIKLADSVLLTGKKELTSEVPGDFSLYQNYPNPFNPSTFISFDIPKNSYVKLTVYDALGREVSTLVSQALQAGRHEYSWNAAGFPSGVYYYRLQAAGFAETKKMVLAK
jgi:photosystem II stability/assembly factor-like uncharacterized protein